VNAELSGGSIGRMVKRALASFALALVACGSEALSPSDGGAGRGQAGSGGSGGRASGGRAGVGVGGMSAGAGDAGDAGEGGSTEAGAGGAGAGGTLRLTGTASADVEAMGGAGGASDGGASGSGPELPVIDRVECSFSGEMLDLIETGPGVRSGVVIGEVFRNLYSGSQRYEFSALIGGPATLTLLADDRVELRAVGDQTGAKPFWRALEVLEGTAVAADTYAGTWTCATLDLPEPGFPDVGHSAPGTWRLEPAP
jgi:hypothetical protein